ncbi:MAG TPA: substrate-binding domain-containing protein [Solirubrobacteraceae bacterium]
MFRKETPRRRRLVAPAALAVAAIMFAGCGSTQSGNGAGASAGSNTGSNAGATSTSAGPTTPRETSSCNHGKSALPLLPTEQQGWYKVAASTVQYCQSPYITWLTPHTKPPWVIGYESTYDANTWRQLSLKHMQELVKEYEAAGLIQKFIVKESGGEPPKMIQQMSQMASEGVNAIITTSPPVSGIGGELKTLYQEHIPVISIDGDMTSPYYLGTGGNLYEAGINQAEWLVEQLKGEGNIIMVNGISGVAASEQETKGAEAVFSEHPEMNVVASVFGDYTEAPAKAAVLKVLSTHPETIDGIWVQGSMEMASIEALQQAGRPSVPVTFGGATNAGVYWREHPKFWSSGTISFPTIADTNVAWEVMMRTLEGQGPKVISMVRPPVTVTYENIKELVPTNATVASTEWLDPPEGEWWTEELVNHYFEKPANPLNFK